MTAFFVAIVKVKDPVKFKEYADQSVESFKPFGGEVVARGGFGEALLGEGGHDAVGNATFPSADAIKDWFASDTYQALVPLRDQAADIQLNIYEVPA